MKVWSATMVPVIDSKPPHCMARHHRELLAALAAPGRNYNFDIRVGGVPDLRPMDLGLKSGPPNRSSHTAATGNDGRRDLSADSDKGPARLKAEDGAAGRQADCSDSGHRCRHRRDRRRRRLFDSAVDASTDPLNVSIGGKTLDRCPNRIQPVFGLGAPSPTSHLVVKALDGPIRPGVLKNFYDQFGGGKGGKDGHRFTLRGRSVIGVVNLYRKTFDHPDSTIDVGHLLLAAFDHFDGLFAGGVETIKSALPIFQFHGSHHTVDSGPVATDNSVASPTCPLSVDNLGLTALSSVNHGVWLAQVRLQNPWSQGGFVIAHTSR